MGTGSWWSVDCGVASLSKASPAQNFPEHRGEAIHTRHRTTPRSRIPTFTGCCLRTKTSCSWKSRTRRNSTLECTVTLTHQCSRAILAAEPVPAEFRSTNLTSTPPARSRVKDGARDLPPPASSFLAVLQPRRGAAQADESRQRIPAITGRTRAVAALSTAALPLADP